MIDNLCPSRDKILIKRLEEDECTPGGIIKPETAKSKGQTGTVLATGPGIEKDGKLKSVAVQKGEIVCFGKYVGTELDDDHLIIGEEDVLAVLKK